MKIQFYPQYERKLQQLEASDDLEWELVRPRDGDKPLLDQIKAEISKVRKQKEDSNYDTADCLNKLDELAYWVVKIKMEVGLPVSPEEVEACPVPFSDEGKELDVLPIVEVDLRLVTGKTPDMAKIELRKHFDEPIVAYILREHFGREGRGRTLSRAKLGELLWPDDDLGNSALIKKFNKLLKQAEKYTIVIS